MKKYLYLIIFIFGLFIAQHASAGVIIRPVFHSGLVGYWSFNEGTGLKAYDKSGNLNHGTLTNMDENDWVDGKLGVALDFDGSDDYVIVLDNDVFTPTTGFTVSSWVKTTSSGTNKGIISKWTDGSEEWVLWMSLTSGRPAFSLQASVNKAESSVAINDGDWHHLIGLWDGQDIYIYVDTIQRGTDTAITAPTNSTQVVEIGRYVNDNAYAFPGIIDEVRIYNRALSSDEIRRLYNMGR